MAVPYLKAINRRNCFTNQKTKLESKLCVPQVDHLITFEQRTIVFIIQGVPAL